MAEKSNMLIEEDTTKYKGNYVAILNKKVIAYGKDIAEVAKKAGELHPDKKYFLHFIPEHDYPMILGNNLESMLLPA